MQRYVFLLLYGFCLLQGASAQDITCTYTRHGNQTTYHLSESPPSHTCIYNWADINNTVLALKAGEEDYDSNHVVSFTPDNLTTHDCLERLCYTVDCIDTAVPVRRAYCEALCTADHTGGQMPIEQDPCCSVEVTVGICACVLLLILFILLVCKDKIRKLYREIRERVKGCHPPPENPVGEPELPRGCYIEVPEEEAHN